MRKMKTKKERKTKQNKKEKERVRRERKGEKRRKREKENGGYPGDPTIEARPTTKVGTRSAIYVWIPKTWSFNKLHKVGDFPTRFTLSLKAI